MLKVGDLSFLFCEFWYRDSSRYIETLQQYGTIADAILALAIIEQKQY